MLQTLHSSTWLLFTEINF